MNIKHLAIECVIYIFRAVAPYKFGDNTKQNGNISIKPYKYYSVIGLRQQKRCNLITYALRAVHYLDLFYSLVTLFAHSAHSASIQMRFDQSQITDYVCLCVFSAWYMRQWRYHQTGQCTLVHRTQCAMFAATINALS